MTRDDIIRMAEQAGFVIDKKSKQFQQNCISATHHVIDEPLTRFATLVSAAEREACAATRQWQGLTDEEIYDCLQEKNREKPSRLVRQIAKIIETALLEKNNDR